MKEYPFLVAGEWRTSDDKLEVIYPYTGEPSDVTFRPTEADIEDALSGAECGFEATRALAAYEREQIIENIRVGLDKRRDEIARVITLEGGRPYKGSLAEVDRAIHVLGIAKEEAKRINGEVLPLDWDFKGKGKTAIVRRFPIGPILAITPFNRPLNLVVHKLGPAIAAGNPILHKPPSKTPLTATLLGDIIMEAGWPPEAISVLPAASSQAEHMLTDDRVKMLTFTGSAEVGWHLRKLGHKKKITLELGGNGAVIVDRDSDWQYAAQRIKFGAFYYAGQACISVQRIFVHRDIVEPFMTELVKQTEQLKLGDPFNDETDIGPMIAEREAIRVEEWVNEAVTDGARLLTGGQRNGPFYTPTLLTDTKPSMKVNCEEVFGPVATIMPYGDFQDALNQVNDSRFGLNASLFSRNAVHIFQAYEQLEVGSLILNQMTAFRADHMPFGGVKDSGMGREGPRYAIDEMTEPKVLVLNIR